MTDTTDYTQRPEVLAACGIEILKVPPADLGLSPADGEQVRYRYNWYYGEMPPVLTMQELWEGLCWAIPFNKQWAHIVGQYAVVLYYGYPEERWFLVVDHGSLPNAVAAALYWVLQQAEKKKG